MKRLQRVCALVAVLLMAAVLILSAYGLTAQYTDASILAMKICGTSAIVLLTVSAVLAAMRIFNEKQQR